MDKIVDARGLSCPQPVIMTKREFDAGSSSVTTLVDNEAARENVSRLGESLGCRVDVQKEDGYYRINLNRDADLPVGKIEISCRQEVVLVASEHFGRGEPELGSILMKSFLYALNETPGNVQTMIFMNGGVKLTCEGSPVLELLESLADKGITILSCGTCLDFHTLKEKLRVGTVTNMYTAVELMQQADKVISI